jgi:murein L,D-transpeptidase YcbB/YkuD
MLLLTGNSRIGIAFFASLLAALLLAGPGFPAAHADNEEGSPSYTRLETALQHYQRIANSGGWPLLPDGPTIRPGNRDPRLETLARRLEISGDLQHDGRDFVVFDSKLQAAVRRFQARHGLETDALVGRNTLTALNVPAAERVAQIRLNMDRVQRNFAAERNNFVLVNVPAFEAYMVLDGETVWTSKVVVGETETETPLFEATMTSVVLNPTWVVPHSIASEELLLKIQEDSGFLARGGYDVRDRDGNPVSPGEIDWSLLSRNNFPYTLEQQCGPLNELGRVKFLFPNEYGVGMHDTPSKHLFARSSRAFSHGCVRLEKPVEFAVTLLARDGWDSEKIDAELESAETRTISLAEPLPVVITYLTVTVGADGAVNFHQDIYGKDAAAEQP